MATLGAPLSKARALFLREDFYRGLSPVGPEPLCTERKLAASEKGV